MIAMSSQWASFYFGNLECFKMMAMFVGFPSMLETLSAVQ